MSKNKKKTAENNDEIFVPEEDASFLKRLGSPGYLLLHPEKSKKAIALAVVRNFLYLIIGAVIAAYIAAEIATYLALT